MTTTAALHFVHITDTHLLLPDQQPDYADIEPEWAEYARQILALPYTAWEAGQRLVMAINTLPLPVDFVLHTGDVAGRLQSPDDYRLMRALFTQIRFPMHYLPGNHDVIEPFIDQLCQRDPTQPFDYEFEQKGVQVVCLDSNGQLPSHAGWLNESQLARLDVICEADDTRPLVVALHHHPVAVDVNWLDDLMLLNGQDFHRILLQARHRLRGVFFGHIHHSIDVMVDGILYSSAASGYYQFRGWPGHPTPALEVGASPGFNVVTITPHQTFVRHYHIGVENFT